MPQKDVLKFRFDGALQVVVFDDGKFDDYLKARSQVRI